MRGKASSVLSSAASLPAPTPSATALVYVSDDVPGYTRVRQGQAFRYRDTHGRWLRDAQEIDRIRRLAIPPAYTQVWICPLANGHLQATGRDARGRKQYRYHAAWREQRDDNKFGRLEAFGLALPHIRARVARDLQPARGAPLGRTLVLATLVRLLDTTFLRVGNDEYARDNGSFGLTTLRNPHAGVRGSVLQLRFRGKSGVMQSVKLDDPKVAAVVRRCQQLPGQDLFQYEGEDGLPHTLGSSDVNDYLSLISQFKSGERFTAKDFRTWHGTVQALELTRRACSGQTTEPTAYSARAVLAEVAGLLGNTPAVCRKSYIHPAVMDLGASLARDADAMAAWWDTLSGGKRPRGLSSAESRLLAFLKGRRQRKAKPVKTAKTVKHPAMRVKTAAHASKRAPALDRQARPAIKMLAKSKHSTGSPRPPSRASAT